MIALGSDHGGFDLKERVKAYLDREGIPYQDYGCHSKESCDYPVFGKAAAEAVASGVCEKGIVICTTGIGISIAANQVRGIRCQYAGHGRRHGGAQLGRADCGGLSPHGLRGWTPRPTGGADYGDGRGINYRRRVHPPGGYDRLGGVAWKRERGTPCIKKDKSISVLMPISEGSSCRPIMQRWAEPWTFFFWMRTCPLGD